MNESQIYDLISKRRTVHRYRSAEIEDSLITRGLELALMAPNHKFSFPWKFVICGSKAKREIYELALSNAVKKAEVTGESAESVEQGVREKFLNPAKIVFFARKRSGDPVRSHEDYASVACAIQNFTTYLAGCGYDSKWSTGSVSSHEKTYNLLGLDAEEYAIEGMILIGKSAIDEYPPRRRPTLSEVATFID